MGKKSINGESIGESDIEVKLTSTNPLLVIPECCRENHDTCPHKLQPEAKREYNPV